MISWVEKYPELFIFIPLSYKLPLLCSTKRFGSFYFNILNNLYESSATPINILLYIFYILTENYLLESDERVFFPKISMYL